MENDAVSFLCIFHSLLLHIFRGASKVSTTNVSNVKLMFSF